jgi:hypothetical protein
MVSGIRVGAAVGLAALAVAAAGCGGSSSASSTSTTTATATTAGAGAASRSFQQCMASHGVTVAGAGSGRPAAGGTRTPAQQQAFAACRSKLPSGARPGGGQRRGGNGNPAFAKYATCLKQHGVTLGSGNNTKKFAAASTACAKFAPNGATP